MPQGGLDWETIAMVAAVGSSAVIGWDWIAARGGQRSDARKGLLEVACPLLFIPVLGLLLKFTDFPAGVPIPPVITRLLSPSHPRSGRTRRSACEGPSGS